MSIVLKNNAASALSQGINNSQTSIDVLSGAVFPNLSAGQYFYATIESTENVREIVKVTNVAGNTLTVIRAQDGTSAASFAEGSRVEARINVASVEDYVEQNAELADYNPEGGSAVTRNIRSKLREWVSVLDFGAVGDDVADDSAAIQAAIDYVSITRQKLYVPAGTYFMSTGGVVINQPINLFGDGSFNTIFRFLSGTGNAFGIVQAPGRIDGLQMEGFQIIGNFGGKVGIRIGTGGITHNCVDATFRDIRIRNMSVGLQVSYAWSNVFDNVRCDPCTQPALFDPQVNSSVFNGCDFVNYSTPMSMSNCEGLVFNAANIANCNAASVAFTLFQSNVVINQPYFENTPTVIASVGTSSETYPSQLVINGGVYADGKINIGNNKSYVDISGMRLPPAGGGLRIDTSDASPRWFANVKVSPVGLNIFPAIDPILNVDYKKPRLLAGAFGGSVRTLDIDREYSVISQTAINNGLLLTSSLEVGEQYVFEYVLRVVTGMTQGPSIRIGTETSLGFSVPAEADEWEVRRVYFVAAAVDLRLLFQGSFQWKAVRIYKNIPTQYLEISSPDEKPEWWFSAAPTTGTWQRGDIVWNTAPSAGGLPGWVCTTAGTPGTWKEMADLAA